MVEQFCKSILQLEIGRSKELANLVMGLASQTFCRSVVEISLSRCYHYQFSSISKAINAINGGRKKQESGASDLLAGDRLAVEKNFIDKEGFIPQAVQ